MRVPYSWLREYCDPGVEPEELAERLAMTGTEVERVVTVGPPSAEGFVVGRVLAAEPHPMPTGSASARSTPATASGRSSAVRPTWPPGRPCRSRCRGR